MVSCGNNSSKTESPAPPRAAKDRPGLILTAQGVAEIKAHLGSAPIFDRTLAKVKKQVDAEIKKGIAVPVPKDMAGGYTHTQHKINYRTMQQAGILFQLLEDETYAVYVRDMLLEYAKMYPTLPLHPQERSYARGKIFWQCLNDSNWLVYTSQAYDCIYGWLPRSQTDYLNTTLFRPFADFLSVGTPQFFNRVHNHSTWGNVAVGMIGLVMNDEELVNRALYGLTDDKIDPAAKDNDGGLIKQEGQKTGFLANLNEPFSPDGYYTEGPYYQRYAMYPFMVFAQALQNKRPELKIFEHKNGLLIKAVSALLNLTDADGEFFPLNDAQKGMSIYSPALVSAVDIAYYFGNKNPQLLSVAQKQGEVQLDRTGLAVAMGIEAEKAVPFVKRSINLADGAQGDEGGIGILRFTDKDNTFALVMKNAAQGLSHGHYDKLSVSFYENGQEVLQDYGLARFVNVEQKNGGGYLKENSSWAKQTIAHNTVVQDGASHFNGDFGTGSKHHPEVQLFDVPGPDFQIMAAKETNAYPGTKMQRTLVMVKDTLFAKPFVVDVFKINAGKPHQYDLPYYYFGQVISTDFKIVTPASLTPLGKKNGYGHLWKEGEGLAAGPVQFTWVNNNTFYTLSSATARGDKIILARIGANDPDHNLRRDPAMIIRKENTGNTVFASIIEAHGTYDPVTEKATGAYSAFKAVEVVVNAPNYTAIKTVQKNGSEKILILANGDHAKDTAHTIKIEGKAYTWAGPYLYRTLKN
ncbi:MAG: alginate lyase family protein [Marinirhabdus sp.]